MMKQQCLWMYKVSCTCNIGDIITGGAQAFVVILTWTHLNKDLSFTLIYAVSIDSNF
jgi:hypothetical protein